MGDITITKIFTIKAESEEWVDAQAMAARSLKFWAPPADAIGTIGVGTLAKICNGEERFWVRVAAIEKPTSDPLGFVFTATVDNVLISDRGYAYGDYVRFEGRHIYAIDLM
jgi:hypothetical protein